MAIFCCAPKDVQAELQPTLRKDPESGCHGECCRWPKKKEGKKRGISWKLEPPEVALVSPVAGPLQGTDLSQVELTR